MDRPTNSRVIPEGPYCYTLERVETGADGLPRLIIRTCPYWQRTTDADGHMTARCAYLGETDDLMLLDQCKICGVNDPDAPDSLTP